MKRILILCGLFLTITVFLKSEPAANIYIRTNQVGYPLHQTKAAFVLTNENLKGQQFRVFKSGTSILTSTVGIDRGAYGNFSHVYELDFTSINSPGIYTINLADANSLSFEIGKNVYSNLIPLSLKFFRVQRCGNTAPLKHGVCHLKDGFASGGWHDAGDYLKFLLTIANSINLMLTAYDRNPTAFIDENHNGKPDVIDEAFIGLDWIYKMWDPARKILYYQVGDERDHQGWRMPDHDDANGIVRQTYACSNGKGANLAGRASASLALASLILSDTSKPFADVKLSEKYLAAAKEIYDFGSKRKATEPGHQFYIEDNWKDDMALGAIELYRATKQGKYLNDARNYGKAAGNAWSVDTSNMHPLAHYEIARSDPSFRAAAIAMLKRDLDAYTGHASKNPFRASVPSFYWGSASTMVGQALEMFWYEDLSGDHSYRTLAQQQLDYVLGKNPWGVSWVNSAGKKWSRNPHHQIADLTHSQLVGFWNEGPDTKSDWMKYNIQLRKPDPYAVFQSDAAVYHDDTEDYVTNEPTIFSNALGIALISWYNQN